MLMNGNAAQPASAPNISQSGSDPLAHQFGPIPDPFLTIQTATNVLSTSPSDRTEDGTPLGRTSHVERMQAARMLATQSLGIGMPRSPAMSQQITRAQSDTGRLVEPAPSPSPEDGDTSIVSEKHEEQPITRIGSLQKAMEREEEMEVSGAAARRLPKPPKVAEVKLPSPVTSPSRSSEASTPEEKTNVSLRLSGEASANQ
jgi:serine/arginine repetitive matrix protein 2